MKHFIQILALILLILSFIGLCAGITLQCLYFLVDDSDFFKLSFIAFLKNNIFNFIFTIFLGYLVIETDND